MRTTRVSSPIQQPQAWRNRAAGIRAPGHWPPAPAEPNAQPRSVGSFPATARRPMFRREAYQRNRILPAPDGSDGITRPIVPELLLELTLFRSPLKFFEVLFSGISMICNAASDVRGLAHDCWAVNFSSKRRLAVLPWLDQRGFHSWQSANRNRR